MAKPSIHSLKSLLEVLTEGNSLSVINGTTLKLTATIIFNGKRLNTFPLRSKTRQVCLFSPLPFKTVVVSESTIPEKKK